MLTFLRSPTTSLCNYVRNVWILLFLQLDEALLVGLEFGVMQQPFIQLSDLLQTKVLKVHLLDQNLTNDLEGGAAWSINLCYKNNICSCLI